MKSRLTLLLLAAHAGAALAQYKCTAADGHVTFQQTPCFGAGAQEKLVVVPNGHPPAASGVKPTPPPPPPAPPPKVESSADKRIMARLAAMKQRDDMELALRSAQDEKARRPAEKAEAIAMARRLYGDDPANVRALRDALALVDSRYAAMAEADDARIKDAQFNLDAFDRAQAAAARSNQ
jgi:hypothetical protein